ncbi:MAG: DUF3617 family protein [Burkholderiales bacterium]|jgi:hypothetical protein|nr:DUF3617 family protein [Burkholderiales bacterium]
MRLPAGLSRHGAASLVILALWSGACAAQGPRPSASVPAPSAAPLPDFKLRSGLWRIGVAIEITPRIEGPTTGPIEVDRCLNAKDTSNLLMTPPGASCSIERGRTTAELLEWKAVCRLNGQTSTAQGQLQFKDTRIEGRIVTEAAGMDMRIDTRLAGRYVGACTPIRVPQPATPAPAPGAAAGGLKRYTP